MRHIWRIQQVFTDFVREMPAMAGQNAAPEGNSKPGRYISPGLKICLKTNLG
jgi:hypothetical protein